MSPSVNLAYFLPSAIAVGSLLVLSLTAFLGYQAWLRIDEIRCNHRDPLSLTRRHCRYCHFGEAHLTEESVRFDGEDIIDVRCFVCQRCGLPQWLVNRTPVVKHTVR